MARGEGPGVSEGGGAPRDGEIRQVRDDRVDARDKMQTQRAPSQTMQRIKVGMIGLAAVVIFIGLASAIIGSATRERPVVAAGSAQADVVANMALSNTTAAADGADEPLAEMGLAPSVNAQAPATPN